MPSKRASFLFSICVLGSVIAACSSSSGGGGSADDACSEDSDCSGDDLCTNDKCVDPDASGTGSGASDAVGTGSGAGGSSGDGGGAPSGPCSECPKGCFYLEDDPNNCGSCGYSCSVSVGGAKAVCIAGQCQEACITSGQQICGGSCIDVSSDPSNCGQCDHYCDAPYGGSTACVGGTCKSSCPSGDTLCGSSCADLDNDDYNCGSCSKSCADLPTPQGGSPYTCQAGQCVTSCPSGMTLCGTQCVSLQSDHANCGSCGHVCGGNFDCSGGSCSSSSCAFDACYVDNDFSSGTHLECCGETEDCNFFWGTDINGNPVKHYYCG
jgi:hypothetical protein